MTTGVQNWTEVRHPYLSDVIPEEFEIGFDNTGLDRNWVWVVIRDGEIVGCLVASECHGLAAIWRLAMKPETSHNLLIRLLRGALADLRWRGVKGLLVLMDGGTPSQTQLRGILERIGSKSFGKVEIIATKMPRENL